MAVGVWSGPTPPWAVVISVHLFLLNRRPRDGYSARRYAQDGLPHVFWAFATWLFLAPLALASVVVSSSPAGAVDETPQAATQSPTTLGRMAESPTEPPTTEAVAKAAADSGSSVATSAFQGGIQPFQGGTPPGPPLDPLPPGAGESFRISAGPADQPAGGSTGDTKTGKPIPNSTGGEPIPNSTAVSPAPGTSADSPEASAVPAQPQLQMDSPAPLVIVHSDGRPTRPAVAAALILAGLIALGLGMISRPAPLVLK